MSEKSDLLLNATPGQRAAIVELISELELDDAENSIRNAERCLKEQGYHELQVMVHNHFYYAGINYLKNEIREILGLPVMRTEVEQRHYEYDLKQPLGSRVLWDCPELEPHEFEIVEGTAKLIPLGEDAISAMVIGTTDIKKAGRMIRRYCRDWLEQDLLPKDDELEKTKVVWRVAYPEEEYTHMFSWKNQNTKNNSKAVIAFVYEG